MSVVVPVIPESAPFTPSQRAWLNGFFAGLLGQSEVSTEQSAPKQTTVHEEETFPWHDPALSMQERLELAAGRPPERQLMAAMAQLDCGSCGYICQTYAEAIANGTEKDLTKCSPGGKETAKKLKEMVATLTISAKPTVVSAPPMPGPRTGSITRENPFSAPLIRSVRLNSVHSAKEVRHVEISLKGANLSYQAGDALGVWPENCMDEVGRILFHFGATGAEDARSIDGTHTSFLHALTHERVLTTPTEQLIELLISSATHKSESDLLQKMLTEEGGEGFGGLHVGDVLALAPSARPKVEDFVNSLGKLQPRLYSISSSPLAHPEQVHLTVGVVRYKSSIGRDAKGVASTFLSDRIRPGQKVKIFLHESKHFKLPKDSDQSIIMVGPGTGIAPFRGFLHERRASGAKGKNWLFFGDQRQQYDFLYRDELEQMISDGSLHRLDVAFSRDQSEKIYVQHRMIQQGKQLFDWLEQGACFYVCGDAKRMAKDVHEALIQIVKTYRGCDVAEAQSYVKRLAEQGRYMKDVY